MRISAQLDDIGMLPAGQAAAETFYRLVDAAFERRSPAVTSNIHPVRHGHAQDPGDRRGRPTPAPRPRHPHRGLITTTRRSHLRPGSSPLDLTNGRSTAHTQGKSTVRQRGTNPSTQREIPMSLDTWKRPLGASHSCRHQGSDKGDTSRDDDPGHSVWRFPVGDVPSRIACAGRALPGTEYTTSNNGLQIITWQIAG